MKVFGEADKTDKGKLKSTYPGWYFPQQSEELEKTIEQRKTALERDAVPAGERGAFKESLRKEEALLDKIRNDKPDVDPDEVKKITKEFGGRIAGSMFKRSDMERGLADAHEEARRMSQPILEVRNQQEADFLKACGVKIADNGKVSRTQMEKAWKIGQRHLGENSNTESLRRA